METRANYIAIGIFTLLVFAMAFGFIYWLVRFGENTNAREVQLIIPSNASGLKKGSGVTFNGLRVGSVTSVQLNASDPANVYAVMLVNTETPLREDTQVTIASQPLTGLANVALVGGSSDKPLILKQENIPVMRAKQSSLNDTLEAAGATVKTANEVLEKVEQLLDSNLTSINQTVKNVETFSAALGNNAAGVDQLLENVGKASTAIASLSETLNSVSGDVTAIVKAVEPSKVKSTLTNVEKITGDLARQSGEVDTILADAKTAVNNITKLSTSLTNTAAVLNPQQLARTIDNVEGFSKDARSTLKKVDKVVTALDGEKIGGAISSLEGFAAKLNKAGGQIDGIIADAKTATNDVTGFTSTLAENKQNFEKIIKDATVISERLIKTSEAITRLVGRVDGLVEADGRGFIQEATDAAKSLRKVAQSFEVRSDAIAGGLERFSTRGLGDIEALISQSRAAVTRIEGIVRNFENNPANFLLSGKKVPEYRRQRR